MFLVILTLNHEFYIRIYIFLVDSSICNIFGVLSIFKAVRSFALQEKVKQRDQYQNDSSNPHCRNAKNNSHRIHKQMKGTENFSFFINICSICGLSFVFFFRFLNLWKRKPKYDGYLRKTITANCVHTKKSNETAIEKEILTRVSKQMEANNGQKKTIISEKWICIDCMLTLLCCALLSTEQKRIECCSW